MTTFKTSRNISSSVEEIFAAISDSGRIARWWGPAGFTNTISVFEFKNGGHWSLVMHSPDGKHFANENVFDEIEPPTKVVVRHPSEPKYRLTIELTPSEQGTTVSWTQEIENPEIAEKIKHIVIPANEQNLERLEREVLSPEPH